MPNISIIIPVFNGELFLKQCLTSVLNQDYSEFEIILIDDGSTDSSESIYRSFEQNDSRIKVIKTFNQGAAYARNIGLEKATGIYVMFCDCDDLVSPKWISRLIPFLKKSKSVFPVGSYCSISDNLGFFSDSSVTPGVLMDPSQYPEFFYADIAGYLWNGIFIRSIIEEHNLRFRSRKVEGDFNEDLVFTLSYVRYVDAIVYSGYSDYYYRERENSLSKVEYQIHLAKYLEKYRLWKEFINQNHPLSKDKEIETLANYIFPVLLQGVQNYVIRPQKICLYKRVSILKQILRSKEFSECLDYADTSSENYKIIRMLRRKNVKTLTFYLLLYKLKRK